MREVTRYYPPSGKSQQAVGYESAAPAVFSPTAAANPPLRGDLAQQQANYGLSPI